MRRNFVAYAVALSGLISMPAFAFDTQTHAYISYQAFLSSNLGNANSGATLQQLGLDRFDATQPFSPYWKTGILESFYFDNAPSGSAPLQYERPVTVYEWVQMRQLAANGQLGANSASVVGTDAIHTLPISNWLMRGAIGEDDLPPDYYGPLDGPAPEPDPYGPIRRSLDHFYDPIYDMPLHLVASLGSKSVDWALGTADAFTSLSPDTSRRQHFSWADARNNYWWALTAERDANSNGSRSAAEREADAEERVFRWATTFRSLGDVIHLLEDAAQPQHTRNDRHDTHVDPADQQGFEPFTNARLIGKAALTGAVTTGGQDYVRSLMGREGGLFNQFFTPLSGIDGYTPPMFTTPLRFFTTRAKTDNANTPPDARLGVADYSNKGFFTRGTTPDANTSLAGVFSHPKPDPTLSDFTTQTTNCAFLPKLRDQPVNCTTYLHSVPDPVAPARADATTAEPLLADGMWKGFFGSTNEYTLTPQVYQITGNLVVPRAIAYSAGMLNYFFRGQIEVSPPSDRVVAVLNQGATHTMNAQGYPCQGTSTADGCPVFGFEKIRVAVRNTTPTITESGTGTTSPQNTGGTGAQLVAVAKYHRNTCYKPDLSGERVQSYGPVITEPTCSGGQTVRTPYQEISVSAPLSVASGELDNLAAGSGVDKMFDFVNDPIPVNATDLFIQVVYRGVLGQEPDGIAVGLLDTREPTFVAFWNNTDHWWNGTSWLSYTTTYPVDSAKDFWACAGGTPVKLVFYYQGANGSPALENPVSSSGNPGVARLGFIFPYPDAGIPLQRKAIRGVPVAYVIAGIPKIPSQSTYTSGAFRQANKENVSAATLAAPSNTCAAGLPSTPEYWCFDPVIKERSQIMGAPAQPFYLQPAGTGNFPPDVDAPPAQSAFAGIAPLATGTIRFNTDVTLASCPAQPSSVDQPADQDYGRVLELREEAASLGIVDEDR